MINMENQKTLFWADQLAKTILERKRFRYLDKKTPRFNKYVVKTSASLSGVLHIGRLGDTIRGESVVRALKDLGVKTEFIWVAEDMDPLRKVPKGVPEKYKEYIGMPVTDIPDPEGCHRSYAEHHLSNYFEVLDKFVSVKMKKFSMREEYKKGSFRPFIKTIIEKINLVKEIQNKYRKEPLSPNWSPWRPICENCGKIITTKILGFEKGKVQYKCEDYKFKKFTAKGCGFEGENNPLKGEGKLLWKGEWAAQWVRWKVVSEGAGKEYQVPGSAFWINAEIVEKVFDFPAPEPIFYEHLMINGEKMSASLGNVIYPKDWLEVAEPELLRFFYNKKLMKTRSFSWNYLPNLYDEYDTHAKVYFNLIKIENEKERKHMKRLYEISNLEKPKKPILVPYSFASIIGQIFSKNLEKAIKVLKRTGHLKKITNKELEDVKKRLKLAANWAEKYAPEQYKIRVLEKPKKEILNKLTEKEKRGLRIFGKELEKELSEKEIHEKIKEISNKLGIEPKDFFKSAYLVLLGKDSGPKLADFILILGKEKIAKIFKNI